MRDNLKLFILGGLLLAVALGLFVSPWADSDPDGLTKVAQEKGFSITQKEHRLDHSPVSGYAIRGVENDRLSTGLAGLIGVIATFGVTVCVFAIVRWRSPRRSDHKGESS